MALRDLVPGDTFTIGMRGKTVYSLEYGFKGGMRIKALKSNRVYFVDPYTTVYFSPYWG
ncbi:MAG: hypothetical protein LBI82_07635 [Dysgonamonadaceae bacterium]|jgi:ABC-type Fe3+-hydroxamate transport system substrate-binding protein|nr:hypothetical protein [Dysgonamonadaceae bacterium]